MNKEAEEIRKFKEESGTKIQHFNKLKPLMEQEIIFKTFFIIQEVGSISIEDLRKSVGSPMVLVQRCIKDLQNRELVKTNEDGKISAVEFEE